MADVVAGAIAPAPVAASPDAEIRPQVRAAQPVMSNELEGGRNFELHGVAEAGELIEVDVGAKRVTPEQPEPPELEPSQHVAVAESAADAAIPAVDHGGLGVPDAERHPAAPRPPGKVERVRHGGGLCSGPGRRGGGL